MEDYKVSLCNFLLSSTFKSCISRLLTLMTGKKCKLPWNMVHDIKVNNFLPIVYYFWYSHVSYMKWLLLFLLFLYILPSKSSFEYFRATFPEKSVTLKMHILEKHILSQIKSTGFALGLLMEVLHSRWNVIKFATRQIVSPPVCVHYTMKKYLTKCMPEIISHVRISKARKKKTRETCALT